MGRTQLELEDARATIKRWANHRTAMQNVGPRRGGDKIRCATTVAVWLQMPILNFVQAHFQLLAFSMHFP